jgi:hypothetical protein
MKQNNRRSFQIQVSKVCIHPVINCLAATSPATLSCSMVLSIVSNLLCYLFCCLCRHPNSKISSYLSLHSEITLLTNNESKSSIQSSCPTHNCIKTGHQSGLHSILSFTIQCFTRSSSLITRNRSSVTFGLKMSN